LGTITKNDVPYNAVTNNLRLHTCSDPLLLPKFVKSVKLRHYYGVGRKFAYTGKHKYFLV